MSKKTFSGNTLDELQDIKKSMVEIITEEIDFNIQKEVLQQAIECYEIGVQENGFLSGKEGFEPLDCCLYCYHPDVNVTSSEIDVRPSKINLLEGWLYEMCDFCEDEEFDRVEDLAVALEEAAEQLRASAKKLKAEQKR